MCRRSSVTPCEQVGIWQWPVELGIQLLRSFLVLYRPESILAWILDFSTSSGLDPAEVIMGCGRRREWYWGLKKISDVREGSAAWARSTCSQWSVTFDFTRALNFRGGRFI